jgi:hypothetical protein
LVLLVHLVRKVQQVRQVFRVLLVHVVRKVLLVQLVLKAQVVHYNIGQFTH